MSSAIDEASYTLEVDQGLGWATVAGVRQFRLRRGRQDELGTIEPSTLVAVVDNADGAWSPLNPAGAWYLPSHPHSWVGIPIRLIATYASVDYPLWRGYVTGWTPQANTAVDADVVISGIDYLDRLNRAKPSVSLSQQTVDARIEAVLDEVPEHPYETALSRAIDTSAEDALAVTLTGQVSALAHIQQVLAGERGLFFVAGDGTLTYHQRHHRWENASGSSSNATFGQADLTTGVYPGGVLPYQGGVPILDDQRIYNVITVDASGAGETGSASDGTSRGFYGESPLSISAPFLPAGYAQSLADYLLYVHKEPYPRVPALTVRPTSADVWAQALGREIGDRLILRILGPGEIQFVRNVWVEGITMTYDKAGVGHTTVWDLSDAQVGGNEVFRIGVSELDGTHVIVY